MKIAILGCGGMLGHQLAYSLRKQHEIYGTLHGAYEMSGVETLVDKAHVKELFDATDQIKLKKYLYEVQPEVVINAIGFIKQREDIDNPYKNILVNALLPHQISEICLEIGSRFINLSTDCVFSGNKGNYMVNDPVDAEDLYGITKYLGEVDYTNCVTLRTSIIGLELKHKKSLVEWYLSKTGIINGYTKAIYSGFTTTEMARIIELLLLKYPEIYGVYHVASEPIDKCSLLEKLSLKLNRTDINIVPYDEFFCDRSLNADEFNKITNYNPPSWDAMLTELAEQIKHRGYTFQ